MHEELTLCTDANLISTSNLPRKSVPRNHIYQYTNLVKTCTFFSLLSRPCSWRNFRLITQYDELCENQDFTFMVWATYFQQVKSSGITGIINLTKTNVLYYTKIHNAGSCTPDAFWHPSSSVYSLSTCHKWVESKSGEMHCLLKTEFQSYHDLVWEASSTKSDKHFKSKFTPLNVTSCSLILASKYASWCTSPLSCCNTECCTERRR